MAKGSEWERNICKFLSKWIQGTEKPYIFWRGHGSGGMFTTSDAVGEAFSGDVYSVRKEGYFFTDRFVIEAKNGYKSASFDKHFKYNKSDPLKEFWTQVSNDSKKSDKMPMLIYKKKGLPTPWLGINPIVYDKLKIHLRGLRFMHVGWGMESLDDIWFFEMKEFFDSITPEIIKEL